MSYQGNLPRARTVKSLDAVTAAGNGTAFGTLGNKFLSYQYKTTGSPTGVQVHLEVCIDTTQGFVTAPDDAATMTDTSGGIYTGGTHVVRYARLVVDTLSGGTAPTITGYIHMQE